MFYFKKKGTIFVLMYVMISFFQLKYLLSDNYCVFAMFFKSTKLINFPKFEAI